MATCPAHKVGDWRRVSLFGGLFFGEFAEGGEVWKIRTLVYLGRMDIGRRLRYCGVGLVRTRSPSISVCLS